jgi:hypothetical protein
MTIGGPRAILGKYGRFDGSLFSRHGIVARNPRQSGRSADTLSRRPPRRESVSAGVWRIVVTILE